MSRRDGSVIRLAIVVTDRKIWTGGYNYLLNLVQITGSLVGEKITPVAFFGEDADKDDVAPFAAARGAQVVRSKALNHSRRTQSAVNAILWGVDPSVRDVFTEFKIDVVMETAQFFGWRIRQPVIAWMADFQHRTMSHLFSRSAYWKRELGFRAEILAGRRIMVSSEDARRHCERFYPGTRNRTHVVRFAVPARRRMAMTEINQIVNSYGLPAHFYFLPNQFWRHKNHVCVMRALSRANALGHHVTVAASGNPLDRGDPDHWQRLEKLIVELGVVQNFRLLGMIPNSHVHALLQSCTALINPSTCEGWSTTVEEGKSSGTPLILSDLPVHREQAGDSAIYFDPKRPDDLAEILRKFVPQEIETRNASAAYAAASSQAAVNRYAEEVANVVACAVCGRNPTR